MTNFCHLYLYTNAPAVTTRNHRCRQIHQDWNLHSAALSKVNGLNSFLLFCVTCSLSGFGCFLKPQCVLSSQGHRTLKSQNHCNSSCLPLFCSRIANKSEGWNWTTWKNFTLLLSWWIWFCVTRVIFYKDDQDWNQQINNLMSIKLLWRLTTHRTGRRSHSQV